MSRFLLVLLTWVSLGFLLWPLTLQDALYTSLIAGWAFYVAARVEEEARWARSDLRIHQHTSRYRWGVLVVEAAAWVLVASAPLLAEVLQ